MIKLALAAVVALVGVAVAPAPTGSLAIGTPVVVQGEALRVDYRADAANATNWVGIYTDPGNGPVDQKFVGPSFQWQYATAASGTLSFATGSWAPGNYIAYGLARDGYAWFAEPVRFTVRSSQALQFVAATTPLRNAKAQRGYQASVAGLLTGDRQGVAFAKVDGAAWLTVGRDGTIGGTPPESAGGTTAAATVQATNGTGQTARTRVTVDVSRAADRLVPTLNVMSWNLWHGGTRVTDYRAKQLRFLVEQDVDVVGIQENDGAAAALGAALGWNYYDAGADVGILSRYPIVRRGAQSSGGVKANDVVISLDDQFGDDVALWNAHLGYTPYGPYGACFGKLSTARLLQREADSGRTGQITTILQRMQAQLGQSATTPILLTGDFNAASHLDWTPATRRCGYQQTVPWPTSTLPAQAGLTDTFRVAHPDPVAVPGNTWSPITRTFAGGYGYDQFAGQPEPQDRIDFVYARGGWPVLGSRTLVVGAPQPIPNHAANAWTSDHAAVLTTFQVS
ncbi:endonuclease/exonuclease/phosphatase family protein [Paractinoplanes lichenicola]|uniref:Endonuclease/exonuclease/phosphatase family protein n=1 Tax=Paractinoplanes lichenicola TaxID=2802976 RepID=A0ABS1VLQ9_9ACTN|nr:endonuclease/exonuclease/phosphatase family protein [Actinoplanes lichenicola]MBL7255662.1 endonuclease/exonuclease/phosphatase family protein [Actinoplanes lichenicola]